MAGTALRHWYSWNTVPDLVLWEEGREEVGVLGGGLGLDCPLKTGFLSEGGEGGEVGELEGPGVGGVLRHEEGGQAGQLLPLQHIALLRRQ